MVVLYFENLKTLEVLFVNQEAHATSPRQPTRSRVNDVRTVVLWPQYKLTEAGSPELAKHNWLKLSVLEEWAIDLLRVSGSAYGRKTKGRDARQVAHRLAHALDTFWTEALRLGREAAAKGGRPSPLIGP